MSFEPNVAPGDSGEYVMLLQERLQRLGYYEGTVDGNYGPATEAAVDQFQEAAGIERAGQAHEATWQAIEQHEAQHGEVQEETVAADTAGERQLSEDGQWWWDGVQWRPVDATDDHPQTAPETAYLFPGQGSGRGVAEQDAGEAEVVAMQLSPDGQWQWDGVQWRPSGGGPGMKSASTADALTGFETGLADLTPEHMQILDGIVADLNAHPLLGGYVTLTGGADRRGDEAMNKELGQRRADAVRTYLQDRITDEETRQAIRAYSLGEPSEGPAGDDPNLRRVDISITRRSVPIEKPHPTDPLTQTGKKPSVTLEDKFNIKPEYKPDDPRHPTWPDWFWKQLPPRPPSKDFVTEASQWVNKTLGTADLAKLGAWLAGRLGLNEADVRDMLNDAYQKGGEEGVKEGLRMLIEMFNETQRGEPSTPQGPPQPIPFPEPDVKTPKFRF